MGRGGEEWGGGGWLGWFDGVLEAHAAWSQKDGHLPTGRAADTIMEGWINTHKHTHTNKQTNKQTKITHGHTHDK